MSAADSCLTGSGYGYHMVIATTQASVNATLKDWLYSLDDSLFTRGYQIRPDSPVIELTPEQLKEICKTDPFAIPNGTSADNEAIQLLIKAGFLCAIQADIAQGEYEDPAPIPSDIIAFTEEGIYVQFTLRYSTCRYVALTKDSSGKYSWTNQQQTSKTPLEYILRIPLTLKKEKSPQLLRELFSQAPVTEPIDMFSVLKLMPHFQQAIVSRRPALSLFALSTAIMASFEKYLFSFLQNLTIRSEMIIGYSFSLDQGYKAGGVLVPTDVAVYISAHKNKDKTKSTHYNAYTLNYLIMTGNTPMPPPRSFEWNWIEESEVGEYSGVVAVNRNIFSKYVTSFLSQKLPLIARNAYGKITTTNMITVIPQIYLDNTEHAMEYQVNPIDSRNELIRADYMPQSNYDSVKLHPHLGTVHFRASFVSFMQIGVEADRSEIFIRSQFRVMPQLEFSKLPDQRTDGDLIRSLTYRRFKLGVSNKGMLTFSFVNSTLEESSDWFIPEDMRKLIVPDFFTAHAQEVYKKFKELFGHFIKEDSKNIEELNKAGLIWVFPGGKTFSYTKASFSQHFDMTTKLLYKSTH